jgi:hypothetical protein
MIIETEPCESCDFTPSVCGCDIELCMMNRKNKADYGINPDNPLEHKDDGFIQLMDAERSDTKLAFKGVRFN